MKKMNRSQSSYRQSKTLVSQEEAQNWMNKYASRHQPPKNTTNIINSLLDPNKENNSLFQSVSERNFNTKSRDQISQFDPGLEVSKKLEDKCRKQEQELKRLYEERQQYLRSSSASNGSRAYNYSQKYYQSEIESLKGLLKQKDRQLDYYKQEYSSKSQDMDSMSSELSCKLQRDNKEKNMYIREINAKVIQNNNLLERLKIHKAEIQTLRLCINEKDKCLKEFEEKLGLVDMKKKKVEHYQYQIKQYNEILKEIQARTQKLKEEADQKDSIIYQKTKSILQLEHTIGSYQDKLRSIQESLIRITEDKKSIMDKNEQLARECSDWRQSYDDLIKKSESLQEYEIKLKTYLGMLQDVNKRNMELMSLNQKYKINFTTMEKNLAKYQQMDKEMSNLKRELKQKEEKIIQFQTREKSGRHLEENYTKLRKQKDQYFMRIQEKIKENKSLNLQLEECRHKAAALQEELNQIQENNKRTRQRGEKMQILMKQNNRLTTSLHEKVNEIEKLQIKINNLQIKLNEKGNQILKMKNIVQQNEQQIHQTKLQVQDLRERYQIQTNNRILNQDKVLRCTQQIFSQKCAISKLQSENNELNEKIVQLNQNHQTQMQQLNELTTQMMHNKSQAEKMISESKVKIDMLRNQVDDCKQQLEDSISRQKDHRMQMIRLQDLIVKLKEQNQNLRQDKNQIVQKCQKLKEIHDFVMKFKDSELTV